LVAVTAYVQANEQGTAIITVLLILMLLTFVAITSTNTVINEKAMVRSEAVFEKSFYLAESAALEGVQKMENEPKPEKLLASLVKNDTSASTYGLLYGEDTEKPEDDRIQLADDNSKTSDAELVTNLDPSDIDSAGTYRRVIQKPIASGSSLALGSSRLYDYVSYGYSMANDGRAMIKVGYKKRF